MKMSEQTNGMLIMIMLVIKHKKDICQSRKIMMKSLMPRVSVEDQDGNSPRNIELPSLNNSKKRKLREKLKQLPLLPLLLKEAKKEKRAKKVVVKAKRKRKKRKKKPRLSHNQAVKTVMPNLQISLLNQAPMSKTTVPNKTL